MDPDPMCPDRFGSGRHRRRRRRVAGPRAELVGSVERYEDSSRLGYVRDPEGMIVVLAERTG
jgi:hypothetical protein